MAISCPLVVPAPPPPLLPEDVSGLAPPTSLLRKHRSSLPLSALPCIPSQPQTISGLHPLSSLPEATSKASTVLPQGLGIFPPAVPELRTLECPALGTVSRLQWMLTLFEDGAEEEREGRMENRPVREAESWKLGV